MICYQSRYHAVIWTGSRGPARSTTRSRNNRMSNASSDDSGKPNGTPALDNAELRRMITQELPRSAVFVVDHDLRYVLADGAELKMAGLTPSDFTGKTIRDMVPRDQVTQAEQDYMQVLNGGTFSREHIVSHRHYHSYGMPLLDSDGNAELALVVSYDVTERVRAERQLRLLHDLGVLAQSSADHAILQDDIAALLRSHTGAADCLVVDILDDTAQISHVSSFLQRHQLPSQFSLGQLGESLDHLRLGRTVVQPASQKDMPACALFETLGIHAYVLVPHFSNGRLTGFLAVYRMGTRRFQLEDIATIKVIATSAWSALERNRTLQSLLNAERHKKQILALLGHELRNHVSALAGGISLLQVTVDDEHALKTLGFMERQAGQLTRMIEDLLGASYVHFGKLELHLEVVSLHDIVDHVIQALRPNATRKRQQLTYCAATIPVMIRADHGKLMQVVTNLISNSIKYTPEGGHIEAAIVDRDKDAVLVLRDNGVGIAPHVLPHLFELFVRGTEGHQTTGSDQTGLGIGLWVVKQFVDAHGGRVSVTSEGPGQGSVFEVTLPKAGPPVSP